MAYQERDWDNTSNDVTKEDFKRIETGVKNNDLEITKQKNSTIPGTLAKQIVDMKDANLDGSLQKQIATNTQQINDLLTKTQIPLPYNPGFIDYATSALESYVVKNGLNECKLVINAKPSTGQFSAGQTAIATLPSGYIPSKGYSVGARNSAMTGCSVEILPNGTVNVYTASASDYVFAVIPYDLEV
ncbi:hypothetical protein QTL86_12720 [Cellulosilyticum sp. ST5]|uniref:hypothetical protein n=1 Tax=Cellulosilyticum sp. ST5 TaxID=3055805 RepID=UPI003977C6DC